MTQQIRKIASQDSGKLGWSITPYLWASDTSLDMTVTDSGIGGGTEIPFADLLDVLESAFQIHVEAGKGNWSGFGDLTYIETSDTISRPLLIIDTSNKQKVLDAAVAYWPNGVGSQLNFFGGLRYSGFDDRYLFSLGANPLVERRSTKDYYDALLGIRYRFDLSERWALLTRGDISFGEKQICVWLPIQGSGVQGRRAKHRVRLQWTDGGLQLSILERSMGNQYEIHDSCYSGFVSGRLRRRVWHRTSH